MTGFMSDFDADLARPFGVAAVGAARGALVFDTGLLTGNTGTVTVPAGAFWCDVELVGPGGGAAYSDGGYVSAPGGGGALARSGFPVTPGGTITYSTGGNIAGGTSAGPQDGSVGIATINYNGVIVAQAAGGLSGTFLSGAQGVPGGGGPVSGCIGNVEVRAGGAASANKSGVAAPSIQGVSPITSTGVSGQSGSGATGGGRGAGGGGGVGGNGGSGANGAAMIRFFAS